jgi:hypothetical protein
VLVALNAFAFRGLLTSRHPDVLPFWIPTWCSLGTSLAAGHIPTWNPAVMGGIPFAADPQSGWLSALPMALFSTLPCDVAIRMFIVLQPLVAGLGLYAFLRSEGASRPACTVGGLAMSLFMSGSIFVVSLPFAGMFAWTMILLACASRTLRAHSWARRLVWLTLSALAWGQLASAHLSDGMVVGTGALIAYLTVRLITQVRARERSSRQAWALAGMILLAFPLVNLAILLPRFAYLPATSLGHGYARLDVLSAKLGSPSFEPILSAGLAPGYPLTLVKSPGTYLGAVALGLSVIGLWSRRQRPLVVALGLYGVVSYVLSLDAVARSLRPGLRSSALGSFYAHFPYRAILGMLIAVPILAALGVDAWREAESNRTRVLMVVPGVLIWGALAPAVGAVTGGSLLPLVAGAVGLAVLIAATRTPRLVLLVPLILAGELIANAQANHWPMFPASAYVRAGPIAAALMRSDDGRYLSVAPSDWTKPGYHLLQDRTDWGLMAMQRSMIFHLEEAQGYNPAQLLRYWTFVRAIDPKPIRYNAADFIRAEPLALNLLQVGYLIQPSGDPPAVPGETAVASEARWTLYRLPDRPPRASVVTSWSVVGSPDAALSAIRAPGFDPARELVLETTPPIGPAATTAFGGGADFHWEGAQSARVIVDAPTSAIVLVRNTYAKGWRATVDGHAAPVLPADYLLQGIPIAQGHHVIELTYHEPTIGEGLVGSAAALVALLGAAVVLASRERWRRPAG